jgi:gamma-glutamylcyclotransferase (GGCT)/AIG2-like uncharacterized protein YtfP
MTKKLPVFVYGTLRKGLHNYRLLQGATVKEVPATIKGVIYPVSPYGGFPCLVAEEGTVQGELMYIKPNIYDKVVDRLDSLEGYRKYHEVSSMYLRRKAIVKTEEGEVEAWVYYWNSQIKYPRIESGDWKTWNPSIPERIPFDDYEEEDEPCCGMCGLPTCGGECCM